ncbi:35838_t:CDS:1, partial [Racocetra persica]
LSDRPNSEKTFIEVKTKNLNTSKNLHSIQLLDETTFFFK